MKVTNIPVTKIKPYEKNAKKHPQDQVKHIANSIQQFGWQQPIVIDKNNEIVIGHGRYQAALYLGLEEVPVLKANDLSEEQIKALRLADNKTNESEWDDELLNFELDEILDIDMSDFGFELMDEEFELDEIKEVDIPDEVQTRCKVGDIWQLGNHRLVCGDSSDSETIQTLVNGMKADMVFTDPPYGVAIGDKNRTLNEVNGGEAIDENILGDTLGADELYEMLRAAFENIRENCKDDCSYYVTAPCGGDVGLMMQEMMRDAGLPVRHILIWKKNTATFSLGRLDYDYQHEPIFYTWTKKHHNYRKADNRTTIWEYDKPKKNDLHPTMKPIDLIVNALRDGTKEGDIVLDIFGGSGSTLIACEETNRICYMAELDPHYCDVIIQRWENMTGQTAMLYDGTDSDAVDKYLLLIVLLCNLEKSEVI